MLLGRPLNEPVRKTLSWQDPTNQHSHPLYWWFWQDPTQTPPKNQTPSPISHSPVCVCVCVWTTGAIGFETTGRVGRGMGWNRSGHVGSQHYRNLGNSAAGRWWIGSMIHEPIPPGKKGVWKVGLFCCLTIFYVENERPNGCLEGRGHGMKSIIN